MSTESESNSESSEKPAKSREVTALCDGNGRLTAGCNDGTVWRLAGDQWEQLASIPQPK